MPLKQLRLMKAMKARKPSMKAMKKDKKVMLQKFRLWYLSLVLFVQRASKTQNTPTQINNPLEIKEKGKIWRMP